MDDGASAELCWRPSLKTEGKETREMANSPADYFAVFSVLVLLLFLGWLIGGYGRK
jgi:hypothetical protein